MALYNIIPTCGDLMSIYTLIGFVIFGCILLIICRHANDRFDDQKDCTEKGGVLINALQESINELKVDIAVVRTTIMDIEEDARETRRALAEINRILIDKLK